MTPLPVGVTRLLAVAALAHGQSVDEYVRDVLIKLAELIRVQEIRAEKLSMHYEIQAAAFVRGARRVA